MSFTQSTPSQAVPGAFLQTPAVAARFSQNPQDPVRRRLFSQPSASSLQPTSSTASANAAPSSQQAAVASRLNAQAVDDQTMTALPRPVAPPLSPLAKAAEYINNALADDDAYPALDAYCQTSSEYELSNATSPWAPFEKAHEYKIPDSVLNLYNRAEVSTMMGLFPELQYVWVTIDNCLYMWDYTHPNPELIGYEESQHSITSVRLASPKPGVFLDKINYILVVATTSEMFLLGVSASPTPAGANKVELYGTKMTLPLRGTEARVIASSSSGRIFFAGQSDPDIHELYYQQEEKWFSSRTGHLNHSSTGWTSIVPNPSAIIWGRASSEYIVDIVVDNSRNLLYSLSSTSTVRTYYIEGPDKLTKLIEKSRSDFLRDMSHTLRRSSPLLERLNIVAISPVSATEDHKIHLVVLTDTGCRLFMSATSGASYIMSSSYSQTPQSMQVQSVKFPPSEKPQSRSRHEVAPPGEYLDLNSKSLELSRRGARFSPGYFVDIVSKGALADDMLFVSTPDTGRIKNPRRSQAHVHPECATWLAIKGRAEDIGLVTKPFAATRQPIGFGNELAVQFDDPESTEFAVLTNDGVFLIRRKRLVDIFAAAVKSTAGDDGLKSEIRKFTDSYGRVESITAALAVACRQGDARRIGAGRGAIDQATQDRARQAFITFGGSPSISERYEQPVTIDAVRPSPRHTALTLYLSRLVRSLWRSNIIRMGPDATGALSIASAVSIDKLRSVQESVEGLRKFLDDNRAFIQGLSGPADLQRAGNKQEELSFQGEHQAMHSLEVLMTGITEGISFVTTLFDERVTDIYARLDPTSQQQLRELTYEGLFAKTSGKELAKILVKAIVNRNIENGSNVETVADALRRKCGSFCSPDDVVIFKAQEQLKKASEPAANPNTSRILLNESLKLFQRVAASLSHANLQSAVNQYIALRYYAGAIQLCLTVASEKDRGNTALSWVSEGKPEADPRASAFDQRKTCYSLIYCVLQDLDTACSKEPESLDGRPTLIATKRQEAYEVMNNSPDEVFHFDLYEWYIQQGWTDRLLSIDSPHVTTFLRRLASSNVEHADLLCRFYTMRALYFNAAQVQLELAQSDFPLSVKDRLTLLSKAKTNVSVMTTGVSRQEQQLLNHEVTELLEIAHIQDDLLERLLADSRIPADRKDQIRSELDGRVQGLSELYNSYADQANYYDICLLIYHAADFRNAATIATTWSELVSKVHDDTVEEWSVFRNNPKATEADAPPQPYERLVVQIQDVCHRSGNDSFIFPVHTLLPLICRYAYENGQDGRSNADVHWPILLFLNLGVGHDLVVRVLEQMFEAQEVPFRGAARARVVEWTIFAVSRWVNELGRHGRPEARLDAWVADLVAECETCISGARGGNDGGADTRDLLRSVKEVKRAVDGFVGASGLGSLRGSLGFY